MPRVVDKHPQRRADADYSPLKNNLDYNSPLDAIGQTAQQQGDRLKSRIDGVVDFIKSTTGVDLSGPAALVVMIGEVLGRGPLGDVLDGLLSIPDAIIGALGGSGAGADGIFGALKNIPGLNIVTTLLGSVIPGLDASKIISGQFPMSIVSGLTSFLNAIPGGNIVGTLLGSVIPGLDASKIVSGSFAQSLISGLPSALTGLADNVASVIDSIVDQWGGGSGGAPAVPSVAAVGAVLGNANRTVVPVPVPTGTAADEVVLVFIDNTSTVPTPMTPAAGFVLAPNTGYQTVDQSTQLRVYWKRCTAADAGTYDFTFDTANYCKAVAIRCTNVAKTGNPFDADVFASGNAAALAGLSLTTTDDNALLVWAANSWGSRVITPPAGFASSVNYSSSGGMAVGSVVQAADGPTGAKAGTISGYSGYCEWMGALKAGTTPVHHGIADLVGVLNAIPGVKLVGSVASSLLSGILGGGLIPGLDASKIISGQFPQSIITGLTSLLNAFPGGNIVGSILASVIPGLDASKITSGSFPQSIVSGLTGLLNAFPGGNIVGTLLSSVIPGLDASKITTGQFGTSMISGLFDTGGKIITGLLSVPTSVITGLFQSGGAILNSLIPGLDASKITSGNFPQTIVSGLTGVVSDLGAGIQNAVNGIVNSLTGGTGATWLQSDANAALESQAAAITAAAAAVAELQAQNGGNDSGGITVSVDFSTYPDSAELPSNFTTTYIGGSSGTYGTMGITNGLACSQRNEQHDAHKQFISEFNFVDTITDYQRVTAVWANSPGYSYQNPTPFFTPTPWFGAYRADTQIMFRYKDVNNWTRFRFLAANFISPALTILETCVNGVVTNLFQNNHAHQANTAYYVEAGTPGNIRTYRLLLGSKVVFTYTDNANVSQVGAAFRGASLGGDSYGAKAAGTPANTSKVAYFALQDNSPSSIVGSGARVYKATTGTGTFNGATSSNFYDTVDLITPDITFTPGNGCRFTVSKTDWYMVVVKLRYSAANTVAPAIYKNGVQVRNGMSSSSGSSVLTGILYLQAGDYVQAGSNGNATYVGSADGTASSFEITRVGKAA